MTLEIGGQPQGYTLSHTHARVHIRTLRHYYAPARPPASAGKQTRDLCLSEDAPQSQLKHKISDLLLHLTNTAYMQTQSSTEFAFCDQICIIFLLLRTWTGGIRNHLCYKKSNNSKKGTNTSIS